MREGKEDERGDERIKGEKERDHGEWGGGWRMEKDEAKDGGMDGWMDEGEMERVLGGKEERKLMEWKGQGREKRKGYRERERE